MSLTLFRFRNIPGKSNLRRAVAICLAISATGGSALAADASAPGTVASVLEASGITESGYVAASYNHSNGYSTYHRFDDKHDSFDSIKRR